MSMRVLRRRGAARDPVPLTDNIVFTATSYIPYWQDPDSEVTIGTTARACRYEADDPYDEVFASSRYNGNVSEGLFRGFGVFPRTAGTFRLVGYTDFAVFDIADNERTAPTEGDAYSLRYAALGVEEVFFTEYGVLDVGSGADDGPAFEAALFSATGALTTATTFGYGDNQVAEPTHDYRVPFDFTVTVAADEMIALIVRAGYSPPPITRLVRLDQLGTRSAVIVQV
jgi:hypothetical protein